MKLDIAVKYKEIIQSHLFNILSYCLWDTANRRYIKKSGSQTQVCTGILWRACENIDCWAPLPLLIQQVWGGAQKLAFLTSC